ncbi:MAG: exosome complex protein Rrp4 [Nanoarchaeota archaeon]|nr:exosome complex protein Rrp4 [Nanoarchaeota archaeon]MBU1322331.1 exosome complex protein Rrp4 [Nanoarchaeota archaeon]MBU1597799.1 exosome complex protein Rrp4 [Nanoarchaeota archaeon]MBU2441030.1 exosome complex protein Rrp4 [Nanoarchaeota archaeon]
MSDGKLLVKDKEVVVPGEVLVKGMGFLPGYGTYRKEDEIIANRLGLLTVDGKVLKTVPLSGRYMPKRNDIIIGNVIDILMSGWRLDTNSPYSAVLPLKDASFNYIEKGADLTRYFELDDYIVLKVTNVTSQKLVDVTCKGPGLHKLRGGRIILVNTHKVPRIIGKKGSMVSLIKNATGCKITVGQNGMAWISGEPEMEVIAVNTIKMIEEQSHVSGLTDKIHAYLEKATGKKVALAEDKPDNEMKEVNKTESSSKAADSKNQKDFLKSRDSESLTNIKKPKE